MRLVYDQHEAIITNHVPRQCTLMFLYSALNYSYPVLHVRASASVLYIVQFPTPPPALVWRSAHNAVMANLGPQSDARVLCGVAVDDTAGVEVEQEVFPGRVCVWLVD